MLLSACYNQGQQTPDAWDLTERQLDSISFYTTHHYTQNYNFIVNADSVQLIVQNPMEVINDMPVDTISVARGNHLVVADIMTLSADPQDSIWVRVARDQMTIGWIHETDLLTAVSPDDPISRFIDFFSNTHLLTFLAFCSVTAAAYVIRSQLRRKAKLVHFNDIASFYPTLLCLLVASSATLYSTIQLLGPESWRHFYYHPTLNPFVLPFHLGLFVSSVWAIIIVAIAAVDDIRRQLPLGEAILYLLGLAGVCAVCYVVFSVTTLYYIGYPLLAAYYWFAIRAWARQPHALYECGNCGAKLTQKGRCPHCGAINE